MNRRKPELQAIDLVTWPGIAWADLDTEARKVITQRMHALELFVQGEPVQAIEDSTGVNRRQLYRWLERGLSLHPDGCVFVSWLWLPQHRPSVQERECVPCTLLCCGVGMSPLRPQDTVSNQLPAS